MFRSARKAALGGKVLALLKSPNGYLAITDRALSSPPVAHHALLMCGAHGQFLQRGSHVDLFDVVFKQARYGFSDLNSHRDQTLALLARLGRPLSEELCFRDRTVSIGQLLKESLEQCCVPAERKGGWEPLELGWTLSAYATYLPLRSVFRNRLGQTFTIERLAALSMSEPSFDNVTEWGTHELMGLATVLLAYRRRGAGASSESRFSTYLSRFISAKIATFKGFLDDHGDFVVPLPESDAFRELRKVAGPHSFNSAVSGHVLSVAGLTLDPEELLGDPALCRAVCRLADHLEAAVECELLPTRLVTGPRKTDKITEWGVYQRMALAHGYDALNVIGYRLGLCDLINPFLGGGC